MLEFIPSHAAVVFDHDGVPYGHYTAMPSKECHMAKGKGKVYSNKLMESWEKVICGCHWHLGDAYKILGGSTIHMVCWSGDLDFVHIRLLAMFCYAPFRGQEGVRCSSQ
uniref:Uncharacterized protein n=1 Tax=Arundo donax TaxID=35708 RepID=A0A0A8ZI50_ARUDO